MASLKNIINPDDDYLESPIYKRDEKSEPRGFPAHPLSTSIPGHATLTPIPYIPPSASGQDQRLGSPSQSLHHVSVDSISTTSPPFSSASSSSRPRSTKSADSMNSAYDQGYVQSGPSHVPMRQLGQTTAPVRLTPVTRRVSKAKKGQPVHTCEQCRPPKTFTRAEHLRRHQLSHQPPDLYCTVPNCGKVFHRKDLLDRHQQRHNEQDEPPVDSPGSIPDNPPPGAGVSLPPQNPPTTMSQPPWQPQPTNDGHHPPSQPEYPMYEEQPWTTRAPSFNSYTSYVYTLPQYHDQPMSQPFSDLDMYSPAQIENTTVRNSLSPQSAIVQSSETLVIAPPSFPPGPLIAPSACRRQSEEVTSLLTTLDLEQLSLPSAARSAIPAYLNVYWEKVDPLYPAIHRPSLAEPNSVAPEHADVLYCAMAAVATQFSRDENDRINGHHLHDYAWRGCKAFTRETEWPLPIMQAIMLCEYYARFRGRKKESYQSSPEFTKLYQMVLLGQNPFSFIPAAGDNTQHWRMWIHMEARRRLLAACFLLDVHSMCYYKQPSCAPVSSVSGSDYTSPETLQIPLTAGTVHLWQATNHKAWSNLVGTQRSMATTNSSLLETNSSPDATDRPSFDTSILLAARLLQIRKQQPLPETDFIQDGSSILLSDLPLAVLYPESPASNAYMALHFTPLRSLLAVSGDSWVFNKKVLHVGSFVEHQKQLRQWQGSGSCAAATVFAARALKSLLSVTSSTDADEFEKDIKDRHINWTDLSDYWALYVCVLICWAFGHDRQCEDVGESFVKVALRWIQEAADLHPGQLQGQAKEKETQAVVRLGRAVLRKDCLGGRNILFADAVNVLAKLQEMERPRF